MKILLIDNIKTNILLIQAFLRQEQHELIVSESIVQAADILNKECFDFILINVPFLLISYKDKLKTAKAKIIAITAHCDKSILKQILAAGFDHYLTTPINRAKIKNCLFNEETSKHLPEEFSQDTLLPKDPAKYLKFDAFRLCHNFKYNKVYLLKIIDRYLQECDLRFEELVQAIRSQDIEKISFLAHSFKGTLRYFYAGFSDKVTLIEENAKNGMDCEKILKELLEAKSDFAALRNEISLLKEELELFLAR